MDSTKTTKKTKRVDPPKKNEPDTTNIRKLKLLITVVNRNKAEFYMDYLTSFDVNLQTAVAAQGTATSETLYMLGLEDSDKSVIFSVIREDMETEIVQGLDDKFSSLKKGKGIAFTVPMTSVIGVAIYRFLSNNRK
jgi:uncharacterized protein YaaQ